MKKFENAAEVGDLIKCYDFEPMDGRPERYVVGLVVEKGWISDFGLQGYRVEILKDTCYPEGERDEIVAPFEVMFLEHDMRITKVEAV